MPPIPPSNFRLFAPSPLLFLPLRPPGPTGAQGQDHPLRTMGVRGGGVGGCSGGGRGAGRAQGRARASWGLAHTRTLDAYLNRKERLQERLQKCK
jgi:hypothetical protein